MPSPLGDVKILSLSISTFVLNTLTLELSPIVLPTPLNFLHGISIVCILSVRTIGTRSGKWMPRLLYHTQYFFICVYPDNDIVYFCATAAARARKMIALRLINFLAQNLCSVYG